MEKKQRSLPKTVSWRLTATGTTTLLVYLMTGKASFALSVGALEMPAKSALYCGHERAWNKIKWGKL
jgi:uncharacterized membrane protein